MYNYNLILENIGDTLWDYCVFPLLMIVGIYLTIQLRIPQITKFVLCIKNFYKSLNNKPLSKKDVRGVSPLQTFFTSIGGCIGIANLITVCSAVKIGGPGAVFWMWIAAFFGVSIKYSEAYLGIKFRIINNENSYDGGPMYYLQKAFNNKTIPIVIAILLTIYGTDGYIFGVIVRSAELNLKINKLFIILPLLLAVLYAGNGGIARVGEICSKIIPIFLIIFLIMGSWILYLNNDQIFSVFKLIFASAFKGHAPLGGFVGSTAMIAISKGISRGCYSGDIGVGYAGIVHAESSESDPAKQASLTILGIFIDTFIICTFTTLIMIITNTWTANIPAELMTQIALQKYFPYMNIFMPIFIFILGYSSLIAFFCVGIKCAEFISPKWGKILYLIYASISFVIFSYIESEAVLNIMVICGGLLLCLNILGIFILRKHIE